MLKYATMKEFKEKTPEVLTSVDAGNDVIMTYRGKPRAVLSHFSEDALEAHILSHSKEFKKILDEIDSDVEKGNCRNFRKYLAEQDIDV